MVVEYYLTEAERTQENEQFQRALTALQSTLKENKGPWPVDELVSKVMADADVERWAVGRAIHHLLALGELSRRVDERDLIAA